MKCPSCGVWNRAHFTKCFRCGADLTDAAQPEAVVSEPEFYDDEPVAQAAEPAPESADELEIYSLYDDGNWDDEDEDANESVYGMPAVPPQPIQPAKTSFAPPPPVSPQLHEAMDPLAVSADEDDEPVTVYQPPVREAEPVSEPIVEPIPYEEPAPVVEPIPYEEPAPIVEPIAYEEPAPVVEPIAYEEPAPALEPLPADEPVQEETRKFAPVSAEPADGATRKFDPIAESVPPLSAQPASVPAEPEVAPVQPGISHEIIHAIFTNPPSGMQPDAMPDVIDEPRPRKLMSRTRRPVAPIEEEPETVYKKHVSDKPEPRVDNVEEFKPTARMAAMIADEKGDEYTAFASAERKLMAEPADHDPFDAAFDIPRPAAEKPAEEEPAAADTTETAEPVVEETVPEQPIIPSEEPVPEPEAQPEPAVIEEKQPEPEQPAWVKEALLNLGQPDVNALHTAAPARPRKARTLQDVQLDLSRRPQEELPMKDEEPATRYERPRRAPEQNAPEMRTLQRTAPRTSAAAPKNDAIPPRPARRPEGETFAAPVRAERTRTAPPPQAEQPLSSPRARASREPEMPPRPQRPARPQQQPARPATRQPARPDYPQRPQQPAQRPAAAPAPRRDAEQSAQKSSSGSTKVRNPLRLVLVIVAALVIVGLLIWGGVSLIKGAVKLVKGFVGQQTEQPQDAQQPEEDPNAPTVSVGTVNGRPGHVITFRGNDNDIIYISNENLENSYNIPIVGGVGTLELEDSALIGNRYVTEDVEVTLNPVLHESGSGKETPLSPVTFTVTPPDAYLEIVSPEGGTAETTLGTYQVKVRVELGSQVTIAGNVVSDMIAEEDNGLGSIVYNVSVEPTGDNSIPIVVQKEGCKSITRDIVITRPVMTVPIELDAATPTTSSSDSISISGKVEAGVKVKVYSPISGDIDLNSDGSFSFTAKFEHFGDNEIVIRAEKGEETSELVHTVTYNPSYADYVAKAWAMDYESLSNYAGDHQPFKCTGEVVEVFAQEPYTCTFNVGSDSNPKHIYLEMVPGKPLSEGVKYHVYADTHEDGTKDSYPYMIGRFFIEAD